MSSPITSQITTFRCVFSLTPRRKQQKTWTDGWLAFHAFNSRVMVYDERGNFVGDTFWQSTRGLEDGDELELDRGGVLVQVLDETGSREQDVSAIWSQRVQQQMSPAKGARGVSSPREQRATPSRVSAGDGSSVPRNTTTPLFQTRSTQRAIRYPPTSSQATVPRSSQHDVDDDNDDDAGNGQNKRCKTQEKSCHARALFGASLSLNNFAPSIMTVSERLTPPKAVAAATSAPRVFQSAAALLRRQQEEGDQEEESEPAISSKRPKKQRKKAGAGVVETEPRQPKDTKIEARDRDEPQWLEKHCDEDDARPPTMSPRPHITMVPARHPAQDQLHVSEDILAEQPISAVPGRATSSLRNSTSTTDVFENKENDHHPARSMPETETESGHRTLQVKTKRKRGLMLSMLNP